MTAATDIAAIPSEKLLAGLLALTLAERLERSSGTDPRPVELILSGAGFSIGEIAQLTGRPYETVKTTLRRGRERESGKTATKPRSKRGA
jgi:DNA-directed RNA polymerase specialized sigma24 family protein